MFVSYGFRFNNSARIEENGPIPEQSVVQSVKEPLTESQIGVNVKTTAY